MNCIACGDQIKSKLIVIFCNHRCLADWYGNHQRIGRKLSLNERFNIATEIAKERGCNHFDSAFKRRSSIRPSVKMTRPKRKLFKKIIECKVCRKTKIAYRPNALYCSIKCKKLYQTLRKLKALQTLEDGYGDTRAE